MTVDEILDHVRCVTYAKNTNGVISVSIVLNGPIGVPPFVLLGSGTTRESAESDAVRQWEDEQKREKPFQGTRPSN